MKNIEKHSLFVLIPLIVLFAFLSHSKKNAIEEKLNTTSAYTIPHRGRIIVLNGCGVAGAGQEVRTHLRRNGFNAYPPENADMWTYDRTIILSLDGNMDLAREVARALKTDNYFLYKVQNSYYDIRVIVGRDFRERIN